MFHFTVCRIRCVLRQIFHFSLRSGTNIMFPPSWVIPQEFMENFRKIREEEEAKRAANVAKRVQEEAEAEEVSPSFGR